MTYFILRYLHVIGAAVLLGTGAGIAFFMLLGHFTGKPAIVAAIARMVVIADFLFTATAVVAQPITGIALTWYMGWSLWEGWIALSIVLYFVTGAFWLPVVWMQMRMRDLAAEAAAGNQPLPPRLSSALLVVVRLWLSGVRGGPRHLLADDRQTRDWHVAGTKPSRWPLQRATLASTGRAMDADELSDTLDAIPSLNVLVSELAAYRSTGSPLHLVHAARALEDARAELERVLAGRSGSCLAAKDIAA
jgi:uncharacterized membrane protein